MSDSLQPRRPRKHRPDEQVTPAPEAAALTKLEEEIGGRAALQAALVQCSPTAELDFVINAIANPENDARTLSVICAEANVSMGELLEAYKRGVMARGTVLAIKSIADQAAPVAHDVMRRAAPFDEPCPYCEGQGATTADPTPAAPNPEPQPCVTCKGQGQLRYLPDLARQKVALELVGLLGAKNGTQINITQANQTMTAAINGERGALAKLQAATDQLLYSEPLTPDDLGPADGEVVDGGD